MNCGKPNIEAIDLFCGIGGLSFGLKQSGIRVKAGLDADPSCRHAFEKNINAHFIEADISRYDLSLLDDYYSLGCTKVLVGCAPCQPFSSHTRKYKNKPIDERWNMVSYFLEAVKIIRPAFISMENVRGFTKTKIFEEFIVGLKKLDYQLNYEVVFCPDYGIPQNRNRFVLIGALGRDISIPPKTHSKDQYITIQNVIAHLPDLNAGECDKNDPLHRAKGLNNTNLKRIQQSRQGGTWLDWDKELLPECYKKATGESYTSVYGRMSWTKPAPTMTTQFFNYGSGRFGHPTQNRALSLREGALLQTFPQNYDFGNQHGLQTLGKHIGNAVPPRLGQAIGKTIIKNSCQ